MVFGDKDFDKKIISVEGI